MPATEPPPLFAHHVWVARAVARRLAARWPRRVRHQVAEEFEAVALEAVWRAAADYDPGRGTPFPRFAAARARNRVVDDLRRDRGRNPDGARRRLGARPAPLADVADPHAGAFEAGTPDGFAHWGLFRAAD